MFSDPDCPDYVYLAADGCREELLRELQHRGQEVTGCEERLVFARGPGGIAAWAQNTWLNPRAIQVDSVSQAARALRDLQRNWLLYSVAHHRRAQLIADKLPPIRFKPFSFPATPPAAPLGAWTLIERDRLVAAPDCSSPFPNGEIAFIEDRVGPPNRAYLKLWEALILARVRPGSGDRCVDLGAAPGGWTWALRQLGAKVLAYDRAPLASSLADDVGIEQRRADVFKVDPADVGPVGWVCSDVVAYPQRLCELAARWARGLPDAALIFTIKFQGDPDPAILDTLLSIPESRVMHLSWNKHELTWFRLPGGGPPEARGQDTHSESKCG